MSLKRRANVTRKAEELLACVALGIAIIFKDLTFSTSADIQLSPAPRPRR